MMPPTRLPPQIVFVRQLDTAFGFCHCHLYRMPSVFFFCCHLHFKLMVSSHGLSHCLTRDQDRLASCPRHAPTTFARLQGHCRSTPITTPSPSPPPPPPPPQSPAPSSSLAILLNLLPFFALHTFLLTSPLGLVILTTPCFCHDARLPLISLVNGRRRVSHSNEAAARSRL